MAALVAPLQGWVVALSTATAGFGLASHPDPIPSPFPSRQTNQPDLTTSGPPATSDRGLVPGRSARASKNPFGPKLPLAPVWFLWLLSLFLHQSLVEIPSNRELVRPVIGPAFQPRIPTRITATTPHDRNERLFQRLLSLSEQSLSGWGTYRLCKRIERITKTPTIDRLNSPHDPATELRPFDEAPSSSRRPVACRPRETIT